MNRFYICRENEWFSSKNIFRSIAIASQPCTVWCSEWWETRWKQRIGGWRTGRWSESPPRCVRYLVRFPPLPTRPHYHWEWRNKVKLWVGCWRVTLRRNPRQRCNWTLTNENRFLLRAIHTTYDVKFWTYEFPTGKGKKHWKKNHSPFRI